MYNSKENIFENLYWKKNCDQPREHILKSRDITLPTKVHLVNAVVFLVVIDGCENWTKTEN